MTQNKEIADCLRKLADKIEATRCDLFISQERVAGEPKFMKIAVAGGIGKAPVGFSPSGLVLRIGNKEFVDARQ